MTAVKLVTFFPDVFATTLRVEKDLLLFDLARRIEEPRAARKKDLPLFNLVAVRCEADTGELAAV
jgi:hypothetical protein